MMIGVLDRANPSFGKGTLNWARLHTYAIVPLGFVPSLLAAVVMMQITLFFFDSTLIFTSPPLSHPTCRCYRALSQALLGPLVDVLTLLRIWVGWDL